MQTYTEHINHYLGEDNKNLIEKCNALIKHFVLVLGLTPEDIEGFNGHNENEFSFTEDIESDLQGEVETEYFYTIIDYLANCWNGGKTAREVFNKAIILYINDNFTQE